MRTALNEPKNFRAIMLSSTFTDLKRHREQVIKAIREFGYKAEVMEESGARADVDVIDSSLKMVRDSAAYALIIGRKYGQTPICPKRNPDRLSITELEFNEAMWLKRPILLFVMDKKHPVIEDDVELDSDKRQKLDAFRERAKRMRDDEQVHRVYETFESLEQFSTAAAIAVGKLARQLEKREADERSSEIAISSEILIPSQTLSNIPINIPRHFLGRDEDLAAIDKALKSNNGRVAITALHGLRGVGKTTLAAAYADQHRGDYRATWWIRAETESTMRADLVGLGVRLGWVAEDAAEESALAAVAERMRYQGEGILLTYDNANNPGEVRKYLPRGGATRIIVTSNAPNWGGVAVPVEIEVWPKKVGADYLIARAGRDGERDAALTLSEALGGLPLAHEQAAAYCERLGISFADYLKRFEAMPAKLLDTEKDAPAEYHDHMTVAKTFALAINEAAKLHLGAESLIVHAALLAPEPIPLFLFSEAAEKFSKPLASVIEGGDLDEAVAALRAFALVDRETIPDERDQSTTTECIRLHRLVRQVAATGHRGRARQQTLLELIRALEMVYPVEVSSDPKTWPRARRLDAFAMALVGNSIVPEGAEKEASHLLDRLAGYKVSALDAYDQARPLFESALAIDEKVFGPDHPNTAVSLNNVATVMEALGDFQATRPLKERALAICEKALGVEHPETARSLNNLGYLLQKQGDLDGARQYYERALTIKEKVLGPEHSDTALSLNNLGSLSISQGNLPEARRYFERALAIKEKTLGTDHPGTALSLANLGNLLWEERDLEGAHLLFKRALVIFDKVFGSEHPDTTYAAQFMALTLTALGQTDEAATLREKYNLNN
jgi:tetratricopeptide (TPR) repeat protein